MRTTYASGHLCNGTGKWNATAWSAVPVDGLFTDHRSEAHVKGFDSREEAEHAAIAKATEELHAVLDRASLPSERPEAEDAVPAGWVFNSADFSMLATGSGTEGSVMLRRDKAGAAAWHQLSAEERETKSLYVYGKGKTLAEAIRAAALAASQGAKE